jgi:hypothetical protein
MGALGYATDIYQAWWQRAKHYGLPHRWFAVWFLAMVAQMVGMATLLHPYWYLGAPLGFGVALGELALLAWVTHVDQEWDGLSIDRTRYQPYYEAD